MELSNALKSLLATLTTKTTAADTDGVMLANVSDGTPNGKINIGNLALLLNGKTHPSPTDFDSARSWGIYEAFAPANIPHHPDGISQSGFLIVYGWDLEETSDPRTIQLLITRYGTMYLRTYISWQGWDNWAIVSLPDYLRSYADLAALATGIMGQNISSITAAYFQGTIAQAVFDNVFIAVTRLGDTFPLAVKPKDWSSFSSASAYHVDGVLLVSGHKHFVIAPSEASMRWGADADSHAASGNTTTTDRDTAMTTFDGKARTDTAVQVSEYSGAETATGYCHTFTTVTSAYDTTKTAYARRKAGSWWLPAMGEMMMIWSNMTKINQVMSLIGGTPLSENAYWTSTEYGQPYTWALVLSYGDVSGSSKRITKLVRPICAF